MANYPTSTSTDANLYIAVDNKVTSLTAGIDAVVTTIPVVSTTGFPAVGFISIDTEIISYTSTNATNFLGATRGASGTTAASHANAASVSHNIVATHHNGLKDETIAVETDLRAIQSALSDLAPASTSTDVLTRIRQIVTQIKTIAGTSNWYDAIAVALTGKLSLTGGTLTGALTIDPATNQLVLGGVSAGNTTTVTAPAPAANRTITIPDGGTNSSVVLTESTQTINGNKTFGGTVDINGQLIGKGTVTNDNAAAGDIGEYISSYTAATNAPANGTFGDLTSISLTAGDWDVSLVTTAIRNGATYVGVSLVGISTTTGNSGAGQVQGDNQIVIAADNTVTADCGAIAGYRVSLASTTTHYFKIFAQYSAGTPQFDGRISARRVR